MGIDVSEVPVSRRRLLQFLAAFGVTSVGAGTLTALEAALKQAHAQATPGGAVPNLQAYSPNWPDMIELWRQVTRDWQQLGVQVDVQQGTLDTFVSQIVAEHKLPHLGSMSWGGAPDRLDPDYFLGEMYNSKRDVKGGLNFGHYRDPEYDKAADAQRAEMNQDERQKLVKQAQAIAAEDNPALVLFHRDIIHAYNKKRFKGMTPILGNGIGFPYMPVAYLGIEALTPRKIIKATTIYDIASLNPFHTPEIYNSTTLRQIYATFVTRDKNADIMPWVLESWNVVNPTTVDLVLRPNQKWHDGKPVTAEDVKFTFDFILKHKFPALARITDAVESAEITGTNTIRTKLKQPFAPFVPNVLGYAFVAPKHIWEAVPGNLATPADWPNDKPIGSGPWKFVEWKKGEYLQLAANKDFFMPPKLDGFVVMPVPAMENQIGMLERGDTDLLAWNMDMTQAERVTKNAELEFVRTPTHGVHEMRMNLAMAPLDNPKFRLALQHATNRKGYLDVIFSGAGTVANNTLITPAQKFWSNAELKNPEFSIDKARATLKDAGYSWDGNGKLQFPKG